MDLSSKYLIGFSIILILSFFTSFPLLILLFNSSVFLDFLVNPWTTIVLGIVVSGVGILYYILLFSPERIKGIRGTYEASPDLSTFRIVEMKGKSIKTAEIPDKAYCSVCGKQIFKPYLCSRCGQLLCAQHYSYGNHQCLE